MADSEVWIRSRAYELWEQDGQPHGKDAAHWEQARQEYESGMADAKSERPKKTPARRKPAAAAAADSQPVSEAAAAPKAKAKPAPKAATPSAAKKRTPKPAS